MYVRLSRMPDRWKDFPVFYWPLSPLVPQSCSFLDYIPPSGCDWPSPLFIPCRDARMSLFFFNVSFECDLNSRLCQSNHDFVILFFKFCYSHLFNDPFIFIAQLFERKCNRYYFSRLCKSLPMIFCKIIAASFVFSCYTITLSI